MANSITLYVRDMSYDDVVAEVDAWNHAHGPVATFIDELPDEPDWPEAPLEYRVGVDIKLRDENRAHVLIASLADWIGDRATPEWELDSRDRSLIAA